MNLIWCFAVDPLKALRRSSIFAGSCVTVHMSHVMYVLLGIWKNRGKSASKILPTAYRIPYTQQNLHCALFSRMPKLTYPECKNQVKRISWYPDIPRKHHVGWSGHSKKTMTMLQCSIIWIPNFWGKDFDVCPSLQPPAGWMGCNSKDDATCGASAVHVSVQYKYKFKRKWEWVIMLLLTPWWLTTDGYGPGVMLYCTVFIGVLYIIYYIYCSKELYYSILNITYCFWSVSVSDQICISVYNLCLSIWILNTEYSISDLWLSD